MRDAAYTLKTGLKLFSRRASSAALQKDKQYKEFIRHNEAKGWNNERLAGEKGRVYAVATDEGVLFFSDSEKGMKAVKIDSNINSLLILKKSYVDFITKNTRI